MNSANDTFFVIGGTLQQDAPSYVERQADQELLGGLRDSQFCYLLTARQMGKSSLMVRTAARLRTLGANVVMLDLTAVGQNLSPVQWYNGLLTRIGQQLQLKNELDAFWQDHERLGPSQRFFTAIREVVLPRITGALVIFVDEIDTVRGLAFSTDEFFAAIRECYNRRAEDPEFKRLTFCLLGVATPTDLIRDTRTTPFNIGRRIELNDFTAPEAAALAKGLAGAGGSFPKTESQIQALLQRVLYWTNGHPYLTQRLCREIVQNPEVGGAAGVDQLCENLFLSSRARERDDNLLFVRERMLRSEADLASLLHLYGQVWRQRKKIPDQQTDPLVGVLKLAGIVCVSDGCLRVRNRIYERVFDGNWVRISLPDAEQRRQQAAFWTGLKRGLAAAAAVLIFMMALFGYYWHQQELNRREWAVKNLGVVYNELATYQDTAVFKLDQSWGTRKQEVEFFVSFILRKPNKFRAAIRSPDMQQELICDGKTLWIYHPAQEEYRQMEAPTSWHDLGKGSPGSMDRLVLSMFSLYPIIVSANPPRVAAQRAPQIRFLGQEKLAGRSVYRLAWESPVESFSKDLQIGATPGSKTRIPISASIRKSDGIVLQTRMDLSGASHIQVKTSTGLKRPFAGSRDSMLTETHRDIRLNPPISDDVFTFTPPTNVVFVDYLKDLALALKNVCINNLRQMDGAKEQWALENKKTGADTPTDKDLFGTDKYIKAKPTCPAGGTYTLNPLSQKPVCSVPDHNIGGRLVSAVTPGSRAQSGGKTGNPPAPPKSAEPARTVNLKPWAEPFKNEPWMFPSLPSGQQVFDGTPFQVDGVIKLYGSQYHQKSPTNVNNIGVGQRFDQLHLLAGANGGTKDGTTIAQLHLHYTDGSIATLELNYGVHIQSWCAPRHKSSRPPRSPDTREAWQAQQSGAAQNDEYVRLFHVALANPSPEKEVQALSLDSTLTKVGLKIAGISVGFLGAKRLPDTVVPLKHPLPDTEPRRGDPARLEGIVKSLDGQPLQGAQVRVLAVRELNTKDEESSTTNLAVGAAAMTDQAGRFRLPPLQDNRLYRLRIVANGFTTAYFRGADPKADPLEIYLTPMSGPVRPDTEKPINPSEGAASGEPIQTLDLKPFVKSMWGWTDGLFPRGRQVLDGTPFQIDGVIMLYGSRLPGGGYKLYTNVNDIAVGRRFERLHLLTAAHYGKTLGTNLARIKLNYSDGAAATLEIKYGVHVGGWTAARHKTERPLQSPDTREVWQTQHSTMAATDLYLRLFHAALTNPSPDKEVRSLSLESAMADGSLMIAGISVGPAVAERLPDTVSSPKHPFPDLRPRRGDPAPVEGLVKSTRGQPLAKARVRVAAVRDLNTSDEESITEGPAVGTEVVTDLNGRFLFPALRDNQLYRLQVTADGFELAFFRGADPKADPIEIRLTPLPKP